MKVSVCMITYNHEKFIAEAINGVLRQICNFEIELIIADDCSPDNTDIVVKQIIDEHPKGNGIKYKKHSKNLGMMPNFIWALKECTGKYIALCEGDDYWTDPLKLQKQVDLLECNEEFVISCHNSNIVNDDGSLNRIFNEHEVPETTDIIYILRYAWYIPTASIVFRNENLIFPKWFYKGLNGDYMLQLILTSKGGLVHYENKIKSSYRMHDESVSNIFKKKNMQDYSMLYINKEFNKFSKGKYITTIRENIFLRSYNILSNTSILSIEFWRVTINLIGFNRGLNRRICYMLLKTGSFR